MIGIMLLFISGNLLAAFAPTFMILLLGRILAALAHGIFMSVSTVIAADVENLPVVLVRSPSCLQV